MAIKIRSVAELIPRLYQRPLTLMEGMSGRRGGFSRYFFTGDKGRVLSEEERAKEAVYIQKMERERMEKLRKKLMEKEKAEENKAGGGEKKPEGVH